MSEKYTIGPDVDLDTEVVTGKHGRYTEADARADAEAFERRGGRPSLDSGVSPQVAFRVPSATKQALKAAAATQGGPRPPWHGKRSSSTWGGSADDE